jgi:hypothetical protein
MKVKTGNKIRDYSSKALGGTLGGVVGTVSENPAAGLAAYESGRKVSKGIIKDSMKGVNVLKNAAHYFHSGKATKSVRQYLTSRKNSPSKLIGDIKKVPDMFSSGLKRGEKIAGKVLKHGGAVGDVVGMLDADAGAAIKKGSQRAFDEYKNVSDKLHGYNDKVKDLRSSMMLTQPKSLVSETPGDRAFG